MRFKYTIALANMEERYLNRDANNPLCSCRKIPFQEMNITHDYNGRVSRNYQKVIAKRPRVRKVNFGLAKVKCYVCGANVLKYTYW